MKPSQNSRFQAALGGYILAWLMTTRQEVPYE